MGEEFTEAWFLVVDALMDHSGRRDGTFASADFSRAARERYRLGRLPGYGWAAACLGRLPFVERGAPYTHIWRYVGDPERLKDDDGNYARWRVDLQVALNSIDRACVGREVG